MKSDSTVRNASLAGCVVKGTAARLVNDCSLNHSDEEMSDGAARCQGEVRLLSGEVAVLWFIIQSEWVASFTIQSE